MDDQFQVSERIWVRKPGPAHSRATHAHNTRANLLLRTSMTHPHPLKLFALLLLSYAALLTGQGLKCNTRPDWNQLPTHSHPG